ncbi:DUF5590 domain-containing protein [Gorillibacterium sp. CAU 1737]|uniref:cell wall elongation regulator TseB-like domain-containing protein n=1 Tax=Gorillibacterium sp. CAU 1737 TaxID=3140362 RepID=UPI003260D94C
MKISLIVIAAVLLLLVLAYRFYLSIQSDIWDEEKVAIATAKSQTSLQSVTQVDPFVGDVPMMVVQGTDSEGRNIFVWVSGDQTHTEYADNGITKESVRTQTLEQNPGAELMRIVPGVYNDEYAWQSFYRVKGEDGKKRLYYSFYRFTDGKLLDRWLLSLQ